MHVSIGSSIYRGVVCNSMTTTKFTNSYSYIYFTGLEAFKLDEEYPGWYSCDNLFRV